MKMIPLAKPNIGKEEIESVIRVLKSGALSLGPKLKEFEKRFSEYIGTRYAIAVNSGTSGLHLCVKSLGISKGEEVITSPFSFIASANCVLYEKAKPVFVDVKEDTFNIDPKKIEEKITEKTKAILPVHVFGQSCDMDPIIKIAKKYNLRIIEDACESIGTTYKEKKAGTFGDCAVFAFYPNKQITTGEGGMIVTNNEKISELCKSMSNQGRTSKEWLSHETLGYNYRMDEMSAALGVEQLKRIDYFLKKRKEIADMYIEKLKGIEKIILPSIKEHAISSWFVFPVRIKGNRNDRDKIIEALQKQGIQSKAYFYPCIHLQPFYKKEFSYKEGDFPIAEQISNSILILPFYTEMNEKIVNKVVSSLNNILK
jgi:perosamine synthetase